jgi:hypothetical protein
MGGGRRGEGRRRGRRKEVGVNTLDHISVVEGSRSEGSSKEEEVGGKMGENRRGEELQCNQPSLCEHERKGCKEDEASGKEEEVGGAHTMSSTLKVTR